MQTTKSIMVAQIIDEFEVVINIGSSGGAKVGDKFLIYGLGEEVLDPATNESLGKLEIVRGRVGATHVQDKLSVVRSIENIVIPGRKKIIKNEGMTVFMGRGSREEIEDGPTTELKQLRNAKIGDLVRPI